MTNYGSKCTLVNQPIKRSGTMGANGLFPLARKILKMINLFDSTECLSVRRILTTV